MKSHLFARVVTFPMIILAGSFSVAKGAGDQSASRFRAPAAGLTYRSSSLPAGLRLALYGSLDSEAGAYGQTHEKSRTITSAELETLIAAAANRSGRREVDPSLWLEQKVTAEDGQANDLFGFRVLVSGNTAVISAPAPIYRPGAVYIFTNSNGTWTQTQKLIPTPDLPPPPNWSDFFGWSLALSGDTLLVGAPFTFGAQGPIGAAFVFTQSGGVWTQTDQLTASDAAVIDYFGWSVGLVNDTAVVGSYNHNAGEGAAYIFTNSGGTWSQTQEIFPSDGAQGDGHQFGSSVAFDGTTILVGAPGPDYTTGVYPQGAAYSFSNSAGLWDETQKLVASDGAPGDQFGFSIEIFGHTSLVGAPAANIGANPHQGAVYVFDNSTGTWTQEQKLTASNGVAYDQFGQSVALQESNALIGEWSHDDDPNHPPPPPKNGLSYLFSSMNGSWSESQQFAASDGQPGDSFGWDVALDGEVVLIGSQGTVNGNTFQGAAYLYQQSGSDLQLLSASSKIGPFEIDLPLTGPAGVECRAGRPGRNYKIALTFSNPINSVDQATTSCGEVSGISIYGNDPHRVIVGLTGVKCNGQYLTLGVTGVHDEEGNTLASADVTIGFLLGDINGDRIVDVGDLDQVRLDLGQKTSSENFREDINVSGYIKHLDARAVKRHEGTSLP